MKKTSEDPNVSCDVLVIGAGAAGMAAAISARKAGLEVIVVEKSGSFGGTTARSAGYAWIPCSGVAQRAGIQDSIERVRTYLRSEVGEHYRAEVIEAFLREGPKMVEFFESQTCLRFTLGAAPDYHSGSDGAAIRGRPVGAVPFDARQLGPALERLAKPIPAMTFCGLSIGPGPDLRHFLNATRSLASAWYVLKRLSKYAIERVVHGRNMHLINGEALAAGLYRSAVDCGVVFWLSSPALELTSENNSIVGARVRREGVNMQVRARGGVVLATGGFAEDVIRRERVYSHAASEQQHVSLTSEHSTGDGIRLAEAVGAVFEGDYPNPGSWGPVSVVPMGRGRQSKYFHIIERAKPGVIAVLPNGRRFVNEALSYHDFGGALVRSVPPGSAPIAYIIADHSALRRYGLGFVKPFPLPLFPHLRSGYLIRANTIEALARCAGIEPEALVKTVSTFNQHARAGSEPEFLRGQTAYERFQGDAEQQPNPCVGPLENPPFYAVKVLPGDIGTLAGLRTDHCARVLDGGGHAINGLYAAGNDMASIFGGSYPGGGANLGPALTFGYIAGQHIAAALAPKPVVGEPGKT